MQQQRIRPKGIYAVLNGAASNFRFVQGVPGGGPVRHGLQPLVRSAQRQGASSCRRQVEAQGKFFTYNVALNYSGVLLLADAIERAGSADRAKIIAALDDARPSPATSCPTARRSSSTARTRAPRR